MMTTGSAFRLPYTLKNYADIIATSGVFHWFFNSVVVAERNTVATLILASLAGYGFARTEFPVQERRSSCSSCSASPFPNRR